MENRKAVIEIDGVKYSVTIHEKVEEKTAKRWRAENGGEYWFLNTLSEIICSEEDNQNSDNFRYASGNYFKTKEEAKRYLNYILTRQKVKDRIAELNALEDGEHGYIQFNRTLATESSSEIKYAFVEDWKLIKSEEMAEQLEQEFTEAELKLALFEIH